MASSSRAFRAAAVMCGAAVVLSGCGSSGETGKDATTSASAPSVAAEVPSGYDPCTDVPQDVLDSEKLTLRGQANSNANGGIKWRGCQFGRTDGYVTSIRTTNLTVDVVRGKNFPETQEFTIAGRRAISTRQFDGPHIQEACTLDVEFNGGSLEFNLNNPPSNRDTGSTDSCELARTLAEKVGPTLPSAQ
ncbi:DUF3558 domain-containing protein [Nocardia callitridis]